MNWSITLGRVRGIAVRLHLTFFLLLLWIVVSHLAVGGWAAAVRGLAFIGAIFGSVLLHEFGHALAARRFGIRTPDITLLPIGGVARLERLPDEPRQELVVALAGPAVNVAIAAGLYGLLRLAGPPEEMAVPALVQGNLVAQVLWTNLWLVLFNLIPAFPMDGGRVLRALLAERMGYVQATQTAVSIGQAFAFLFVLAGLFLNPWLIFIGLFVYQGAAAEVSMAQMRDFARSVPVASVMLTRFRSLRSDDSLREAVAALLEGPQREFPVVDGDGRVEGILCREDMIRALAERGPDARVGDAMQVGVPSIDRGAMLSQALETMMTRRLQAVPVVGPGGVLVGLLTRENLAEAMMVEAALEQGRHRPVWSAP